MNSQVTQIVFLGAMAAVFWFVAIRPQQQRARQQREMLAGLAVGDEVVTFSGIFGTVVEVAERLTLATVDGSRIQVAPEAVASLVSGEAPSEAEVDAGEDELAVQAGEEHDAGENPVA